MFDNILLFIVVFSIFSFYEPKNTPAVPLQDTVLYTGMCLVIFFLLIRSLFNRLIIKHRLSAGEGQIFGAPHGRLIQFASIAAIGLYGLFVYLFDLKYYFMNIQLLGGSAFFVNLCGIALFLVLLGIVWTSAFPAYRIFYDHAATLTRYIQSHLRLNAAIIVPWLMFSLLLDLVQQLPDRMVALIDNHAAASYILFAAMLIATGYFFPWVLVRIWNCRPLPAGPSRDRIELFCKKAGFDYADIVLWNLFDGRIVTAGVLGLAHRIRYLLISPSLLSMLNESELESVVAHEIGHIKCRHMIFYLCFVLGYSVFAYAVLNFIYLGLLSQDRLFDLFINNDGTIKAGFYAVPAAGLIAFLLAYFRLLFGVFSRNFERQSDAYAVKLCGNAAGIIRSLEKIGSASTHSRTSPNWHHYSIQERIDFLRQCETNQCAIERHDKKVRMLVGSYFIGLVLIGSMLYGIDRAVVGGTEMSLMQRVIEKRIIKDQGNASLHFILANIYYEKGMIDQAAREYLSTLELRPEQPEALNNLAWLYATAEKNDLRRPQAALKLALKAARLDPQPHILDTLAESYAVNGRYKDAVETIRMALTQNPPKRSYYLQQLERFEKQLQQGKKLQEGIRDGTYVPINFNAIYQMKSEWPWTDNARHC